MNTKIRKIAALPLALLMVLGLISPSFLAAQTVLAEANTPLELKFNMAHPGASQTGMEEWTSISPATPAYSPEIGYGVLDPTGLNSRDRNQPGLTPLENQFLLGVAAFRVDLPNGHYRVTVYSGDPTGSGTTNMNVSVDGSNKGRISVKAGVSSLTFEQEAVNGYILLDFSGHLYLNGIVITEILPEIPEAPTSLQATASYTSITLNWQASATDHTSYQVYRSPGGENQFEQIAEQLTEPSYQDTTAQ